MRQLHWVRRVMTYTAVGVLASFGLTTAAFADTLDTITNTGTNSTNTISSNVTDNCQVTNDTNISVMNSNDQSASTGNALAADNSTLPWEAATTGAATNSNSVSFVFTIDNTASGASTTPTAPAGTDSLVATDACGNPVTGPLPAGGKGSGPSTGTYTASVLHSTRKIGGKGAYYRSYYRPVKHATVHVAVAPVVHTASAPAAPTPTTPAPPSTPTPVGNTISNTGTGSRNVIASSYTDDSSVHNTNTVSASNMNVQTASSGNAASTGNTTAGSGGSGGAANGNSTGMGAGITN